MHHRMQCFADNASEAKTDTAEQLLHSGIPGRMPMRLLFQSPLNICETQSHPTAQREMG